MNRSRYYLELKHLMEKAGLTNADMAYSVIGIGESTLSARMCGKRPFNVKEIYIISKRLGIPEEKCFEIFVRPFYKAHMEDIYTI